jgi:hypothetical protein
LVQGSLFLREVKMAKRGGVIQLVGLLLFLCLAQCAFFVDAAHHRRRDVEEDDSVAEIVAQNKTIGGESGATGTTDNFLKEIEEVDEEANEGVRAEQEKLQERQEALDEIQEIKDNTTALAKEEIQEDRIHDKELEAAAEMALPTPEITKEAQKSWIKPVDYMIDPHPKKIKWKPLTDRSKLYATSYPTPVEGVLVTLYNPRPDRLFTVWDYSRIASAINEVAVHSSVPMDKETRCFCYLVAQATLKNHPKCVCTHPAFPLKKEQKTPTPLPSFKKVIKAANEEDVKAHIAKSKKMASEARVKKEAAKERRIELIHERLEQHREKVHETRAKRLSGELNALENYGSKFMVQKLKESRKSQGENGGPFRPVPKPVVVHKIQETEADVRTLMGALAMQRTEVVARIKEYARLNRMATNDLEAAGNSAHFLGNVMSAKYEALVGKYMAETPLNYTKNLPKILEHADEETRPTIIAWLLQKQNESWARQVNETEARLTRLHERMGLKEEEYKAFRAKPMKMWLMEDREYVRLEQNYKRVSEQLLKAQRHYAHESRHAIDEETAKSQEQRKKAEETEKLDRKMRSKLAALHAEMARKEEMRKQAAEQAAKARALGLARKHGVAIDISPQLNRLKIMRSKLEEATKSLEREYKARETSLGTSGTGDEVCTVCKKEDQIFILENEILKDMDKLRLCKAKPAEFAPGCAETIQFEIDRLQQEVNRRRALLAEMIVEYRQDLSAVKTQIKDCRARSRGCPTKEQQSLLFKQKNVEDILEKMEKRDQQRTILKIYRCLYDHREIEGLKTSSPLHRVDTMFGAPQAHFSTGCPKLEKFVTKIPSTKNLFQCICADYDKTDVLAKKVSNTEGTLRAKAQLEEATKVYREKKKEEKAEEQQEAAKEVLKEEIVDALKNGDIQITKGAHNVDDIAKRARMKLKSEMSPSAFKEREKKIVKQALAQSKERHEGRKGCDKPSCADMKGPKIPPELMAKCMSKISSSAIQANLKKAFDAGTHETGCALLSLASNSVLRDAHDCLCPNSVPGKGV